MRNRKRIWGAALAMLMLWQLSGGVFAVEAGTAVPFSWENLEVAGSEHHIICHSPEGGGDIMPLSAENDMTADPAAATGAVFTENELITPVSAYDGPVVTFVAAANSAFLGAGGSDAPKSVAEVFAECGVRPSLSARETDNALPMEQIQTLVWQGYDLLDGGAALTAASDEQPLSRVISDGRAVLAGSGLRPRGFLYPEDVEISAEQLAGVYEDAVRIMNRIDGDQPYNPLEQDRLELKAAALTNKTVTAVRNALKKTVSDKGWLIVYVDADELTAENLRKILDEVGADQTVACLPFAQALAARYGGVVEKSHITLFGEKSAPAGLAIGGLIATNYNADYITEQGTEFALFCENGVVNLALNSVLAEDLEVAQLSDVTPEVKKEAKITETRLTYSLGAENFKWVVEDESGDGATISGKAAKAYYKLVGEGEWSGEATVEFTISNTTGAEVKLVLAASPGDGLIRLESGVATVDGMTENLLLFDSTTSTLTVQNGANGATMTVTIHGDKISGSYDVSADSLGAVVSLSLTAE